MFLAKSTDGKNYTGLLNNTYFYKIRSDVGSGNTCVRDPYMNRLHDDDETDNISWFVMVSTDWTNWRGSDHSEYGTKGFSDDYWNSEGYSPSIIISVVKVDTENKSVEFLKPVPGNDPFGATARGSICKRMVTIPAEVVTARGRQMHAWAPEILLDYNEDGSPKPVATINGTDYYYGVFWSGNGDAVLQNDDGSYQEIVTSKAAYSGEKTISAADFDASVYTEGWICRTFINYTNDFATYTRPYFYFEDLDIADVNADGQQEVVSEIDATMLKVDDVYYMPFKGEASGALDINLAKSLSLDPDSFVIMHNGQWISRTKNQTSSNAIEGPWMILDTNGNWWLFGDNYGSYDSGSPTGSRNFSGFSVDNVKKEPKYWSAHFHDGKYSFPVGIRHGFAFRVTEAEMAAFESVTGGIEY